MLMRTIISINDILHKEISINRTITVQGWIRNKRNSKSELSFLTLYDGSCFQTLQIIATSNMPNYYNEIIHLTTGCSITTTGQIIQSIGKNQNIELLAKNIKVLGWITKPETYPISPKKHSMEYLRKFTHLRARTNIIGAVSRIRHILAQSIHCFMNENNFLWIPTPLITASDTEGNSKMFHVSSLNFKKLPYNSQGNIDFEKDFFGKETFLTVSGQLNAESYACALSKVYTFGPIFRADPSDTNKHLAEFWMTELEIAFADLEDLINLAKSFLQYISKIILTKCIDDIQFFIKKNNINIINRLEQLINNNYTNITYTEAINILKDTKQEFKNKIFWGMNLFSEHEKYLTDKYFNMPVIIKNYPKNIKPFYMRLNKDNKTTAAIDILLPSIGEVIGGSQREERLEFLDIRLQELGLNKNNYQWYRDLRRYGTVPHSGLGLGFERLILYITGIKNIRDVIPFPRTQKNIDC